MPLFIPKKIEQEEVQETPLKTFIVVTKDFSGLGFAKMIAESGNKAIIAYKFTPDDEHKKEGLMVGKGMVETMPLDAVFNNRGSYNKENTYWIFDMNVYVDYADKLRKEKFKVFGGQKVSEKMEHTRDFATKIVESYGLKTPPTTKFTTVADGLKFLDENEDKAYVFKPDNGDGAWTTYVPDSEKDTAANRELYTYMQSGGEVGPYILQERIKGVEMNVEVWIYEGKPFFAFAGLECKRKSNHDLGEMVGCAQDINFTIPLDSKAIKNTVGKLFPFYEEMKYTGFADVNIIVADNDNFFLEVCNRFGYNAHPNLFTTLARRPFGDIISDFVDGKVSDFYNNFKFGFGSSILMYIDHKSAGMPIYISEDVEKKFYPFDLYKKDDQHYMAGYGHEIGIITGHGFTIKESAEDALKNAEKVNFPMRNYRSDLDLTNYPSSPASRFAALEAMRYFQ